MISFEFRFELNFVPYMKNGSESEETLRREIVAEIKAEAVLGQIAAVAQNRSQLKKM